MDMPTIPPLLSCRISYHHQRHRHRRHHHHHHHRHHHHHIPHRWHMAFCSMLAFVLVASGRVPAANMSMRTFLRAVVPISALYAGTLWLGNAAYLYLSVSFIQMLKVWWCGGGGVHTVYGEHRVDCMYIHLCTCTCTQTLCMRITSYCHPYLLSFIHTQKKKCFHTTPHC